MDTAVAWRSTNSTECTNSVRSVNGLSTVAFAAVRLTLCRAGTVRETDSLPAFVAAIPPTAKLIAKNFVNI